MTTRATYTAITERFYREAQSDLVGLWQIVRAVAQGSESDGAVMEDALSIARTLLSMGLRAGDPPYSAGGFRPWDDQNPDTVIQRIRSEWISLGRRPDIPDIVWFDSPIVKASEAFPK